MAEVNQNLAKRLRELRRDTSLYEVEKNTGVPRINLSRYEKGMHLPTSPVLQKLAEFYNVPYAELKKLYFDDFFEEGSLDREVVVQWAIEQKS